MLVLALALLSWRLCLGLAAGWQGPRHWRVWMTLILLSGFWILPAYTFGRREHLLTILIAPYLLCAALRAAALPVPTGLAVIAGVMAGISVGIKPHFVLIAAEAALLLRALSLRGLFRAESLALAASAGVITAEVFLLHPAYVFDVLPMVTATYEGFNNPELVLVSLAVYLFLMLALAARPRGGALPAALRDILGGAIVGALLSFVIQGKGWYYHGYPIVFLLFTLGCAGIAGACIAGVPGRGILRGLALAVIVTLALAIARPPDPDDTDELEALLRDTPGSFYIAETRVYPAFPLATTLAKPWASRFAFLVTLPALVKAEARGDDSLRIWATYLRSHVAEDIARFRPALVLVPSSTLQSLPPGFDIIAWLSEDADFAAAWAAYRPDGKANHYLVYRRQ